MNKIIDFFKKIYDFIFSDIWKLTENELTRVQKVVFKFIKTVFIAIRGYMDDKLSVKASALTYSVLFAAVPLIALVISISKGFGADKLIENALDETFIGKYGLVPEVMGFVEKYLQTMSGGLFVGIGIVILLWSVLSFFMQMESAFNEIWQVKKSRSIFRQFTIYFSAIIIIPALIAFSSGFSVYIKTQLADSFLYNMLSPLLSFGFKLIPYVVNWIVFTLLYMMMPNTRVKFVNALIAGLLTGTIFLIFQNLYISGQINLTRYNAVYGSFAAIPLLLFFIYISCLIILLGAEISYALQNIHFFDFETDTKNISIRYKNFVTVFITYLIVKRFENEEPPLSNDDIVQNYLLPIRLVNFVLMQLVDAKIVVEVTDEKRRINTYQPAFDINTLTISKLFYKLNTTGSEMFLNSKHKFLTPFWDKYLEINNLQNENTENILIKDIINENENFDVR
ncbi:MAG: YihY/virulence factor BrkB family protein [Paludibacter sp.]|nr:YihY/virulence factor BrkB family protein [Paludibacter sp.]